MSPSFDHEKLNVYQEAIRFVSWSETIIAKCPKKSAVYDQLDRAASSIVLNIAEGNGKFSYRDRCRFLEIARGSALECAAALDILIAKKHFGTEDVKEGKQMLFNIVSMLVGLLQSLLSKVKEEREEYDVTG